MTCRDWLGQYQEATIFRVQYLSQSQTIVVGSSLPPRLASLSLYSRRSTGVMLYADDQSVAAATVFAFVWESILLAACGRDLGRESSLLSISTL